MTNYALLLTVLSAAGGIKVRSPGMNSGTIKFRGAKIYFLFFYNCQFFMIAASASFSVIT